MKKGILLFFLSSSLHFSHAQTLKTFKITNPKASAVKQRGFEVSVGALKTPFELKNTEGGSLPYQLDDLDGDGSAETLFFQTDLAAKETKTFSLKKVATVPVFEKKTQAILYRQPHDFDTSAPKKVTGAYVSEKKYKVPQNIKPQNYWFKNEGPTWENDLIGYRFYADHRHRYDIFGKKVTWLALDTSSVSTYHEKQNWGTDVLKVGDALGMASPAFLTNGKVVAFEKWDEKEISIVASGVLRSIVKIRYKGLQTGNGKVNLVETITLEAGSPISKVRLQILNPTKNYTLATGIVRHGVESKTGFLDSHFFGSSFGKQAYHGEELGMAILINKKYTPLSIDDKLSYVYSLKPINGIVEYQFFADWSGHPQGSQTMSAFEQNVLKKIDEI